MSRCTSVILLAFIITVEAEINLLYDTVSVTHDGGQCMNNCVNHKCVINYKKEESRCYIKKEENGPPVYYTSQKHDDKQYCLSQCGTFGTDYDWCFTSNQGHWDYCSSKVMNKYSTVKGTRFTKTSGPCRNWCKRNRSQNNKYTCTNYWGYEDECNPKKAGDYIQAYTIYGTKCVGTCTQNEGKSYFWCYDANRSASMCAPPAF